MNKTSIIYLFLIVLLLSACKDEITTGFNQPEGDKLTVTAVMPEESSEGETRVSLYEKSGSLQIESKWQTNDQIHFFFRQNGNIVDAGKVTVSNPTNGGKQVSFEINYPQGINPANPFDLYAFCGTEAKVKNGNLLVDINPQMCNYLENVSAPVWCDVKNIRANNSSLSLNFKHLGTYELIHLNNKSSSSLSFNLCNLYPWSQGDDIWYHIPQISGDSSDNYYYDPVLGIVRIVRESTTSYSSGSVSSTVLSGSTKVISNWYFPNNKSVPNTKLKLYSPAREIISANSKSSRNSPLLQSKAYHLFATYDGTQLRITDENFNDDEGNDIEFGSFIDLRDGNVYKTVQIGDQVWMAENLKYLPAVFPPEESEDEPYYYVYGYNGANVTEAKATENYQTYGVLYNWLAAMDVNFKTNNTSFNGQGICPDGWHLPTNVEWNELESYLGSNAGGKLKHTDFWLTPNRGAINEMGFSALPGGVCKYGDFKSIKVGGYWWTSSVVGASAVYRYMHYDANYVSLLHGSIEWGHSIRCVKGDGTIEPPIIYNIAVNASPVAGGSVAGSGSFKAGEEVSVTATASTGYKFVNWTGDVDVLSNPNLATATFKMPAKAVSLIANFKKKEDNGQFATFTDPRDASTYKTVKIGNQVWMAENLKYLPKVSGGSSASMTEPHYYVYGYNGIDVPTAKATENYQVYGVLYNWPAAMQGAASNSSNPSGVQGVCPDGWHLPSDAEWDELQYYLIANGYNYDGTATGNKIAIAMAESGLWRSYTGAGTIGNNANYPNHANKSGFSALPGGFCADGFGHFYNITLYGRWWSSTDRYTINGYARSLGYDGSNLLRYDYEKYYGFSVRCVRD